MRHSPRHLALQLAAVAHYHDFIQHFGVFEQSNFQGFTAFQGYLLRGVSYERNKQRPPRRNRQGETAIHIGDCTVLRTFLLHIGSDHRLSVPVFYNAGHCYLLQVFGLLLYDDLLAFDFVVHALQYFFQDPGHRLIGIDSGKLPVNVYFRGIVQEFIVRLALDDPEQLFQRCAGQ